MTVRLLVFTSLLLISGGESGSGSTKRRSPQASSSSSSSGTPVDFDCPEEFGYYAHPTDCTQYYVCVFGGALLESCTGGLMYSHELQTCDWPRNVGCAPGTTASQQVQPETRQRQSTPQRERIIQQQIPKHDLYTEDEQLPAEELDSDRQQRVYRGQPKAIGQVQSDRDGLSTHSNAIPIPGRDKLSVVSYGTQQQYTSSYRHKPTGDVIQDKSDHNFLTNVTRRTKRQAPMRSHQDGRPESYDSSPISWSSFQPRIIHHRRPQLIPSVFPSPQPPPPHPSHPPLHPGGSRPRPSYHTHRRPNEFKFEPFDAKTGAKFVSTTTLQTPVEASSRPSYYLYHNQPSFSAPVESKYHIVHTKQSTFRPSFGPPAYQPYQTNTDLHTSQRPQYESTTKKPVSAYRSQVTKPPLTHHSSTSRNPPERKPTSYVYSSNTLNKESGLQLNQESAPNSKPSDDDGDSTDEDTESDDEYDENEDTTDEEKQKSRESDEKSNSNENASASKSSNESFRPKFPRPPPEFYKDSSSASESLEKNPFANPDFDFNKFLDDLRDHPQTGGPSTSSELYFEYSPSSSSKESSRMNDYYYPKQTTPKYYNSVEDGNNKYLVKDSSYNQGQSYSKDTSHKHDDYSPSKEYGFKPNYNPSETLGVPKDTSSKNHNALKQSPVNFIDTVNSPEDSTSKYFYNTGKQNHVKYAPSESTTKYNVFASSEQPFHSQTPQYYYHSQSDGGSSKNKGQYKHPSLYTFTTEKPSSGNAEEYIDDFIIGKRENSTLLGPPRPPKQPFRLQNIDNHAQEEEEEYDDENEDDSEEYYDDDEDEEQADEEEYEDEEVETPVKGNTSGSKEKSKSEEDPRISSQSSSASLEHMTSNTKHSQSIKPTEHTTPNHLIKSTSMQAGKCFSVRGKVKCLDFPSTTVSTSVIRHHPSAVYPNNNHYQSVDHTSSTSRPSPSSNNRPRMRRPTSPLPPPTTSSTTLAPPPRKFTPPLATNSSRQTPMLLSPSYPNSSTEPVAVIAKKPRQRQNKNKSELSEDTDMRDKGHTQRALTRLRASVTPAQQQYVEQQTTQQQTTPTRAYNQSRYVPSQYDPPFYTLYDDEVDLYKEIGDYAQYNTQGGNQYRNQATYKEKKPQIEIVQQEPVRGSAYSKNTYNTQSDIYQSVTPQEYESYNIQTNDDLQYRQPQQTKSSTRSEVKEAEGSDRSHVSTASSGAEKKFSSEQTVQQTDSTTIKTVTPPLPEGPKIERLVSDGPFVIKLGGVVNTPSPFKLPETETETPVNLLTRGHFIVREPEVVTQQVVDITPKPNNRNRDDSTPQRTIAIRVPQAAIDVNKFNSNDEPKQRPAPIRASDSAEWSGFRLGGEVGSNHQEEISRRPSLRVPDSIKIREEYLRSREGVSKPSERNNEEVNRSRTLSRKTQDGRGSSRYQESVYELDEFTEPSSAPQLEKQQNFRVSQSTPSFRADTEEEQKFLIEAERNARIQAQIRSQDGTKANQRDENNRAPNVDYRRRQEEVRRKAYEEARVRQIEEAEREAKEQVRQKQLEDARRKQVEESERIAAEIAQKKEIEEAQKRANEEARRRLIEDAKRRANEEARRRQIEEAQKKAREEYERKAREEAMKKAAEEEEARQRAEEETRKRQLLEARRAKEEAERRAAKEEAERRAAIEEAERRAAYEEAQRRAAYEEAQRRAAVEEAQRRAAVEEAKRKSAAEEAQRKAEEAQRKADMEEAQRRSAVEEAQRRAAVQEAKRKAAEETRRRQLENQKQLEDGLSRRRLPSRTTSTDSELSFRPSYENTERYRQSARQGPSFRIVVDTTEPSSTSVTSRTSPFGDARPPKKYVSRNSTLVNELYLNEQSTSFPDNTVSVTPNTLIQTSPGRTYTDNTRKTLDTPIPISKSDPEYSEKSVRVRPTTYDTQSTPGLTRGNSRHRGSQSFTVSPNDAEPAQQPNRGTPAAPRVRPTLKPSTTVVGKASEYTDIYRYPPRRPDNVYPTPQVDKTAAKCRKDVCLIPDCSCGGKDIPGELTLEETPQIVLLTFDDSVNDLNKGLYEDLFEKGRVNPNGCPISATFYVSHEWTDYSQVQNLYSTGHEIASHSVSHSFGEQFSQKKWTKEISGQREILSAYGGVKMEDIRGMRAPFLAIGGNKMFKMLYDSNFTYDSSMPVYENRPPSWPYTMDYKIFHDCMIPPCPTKSYPGVWEVPMVMWQDLNGGRCSMGDACSNPPNAEGVYKMLIKNFERHFTTNRAPFGLFYHAAWFTQPQHKEGFIAFLDTINKMPEVWLVTNWQAIQWVRDPTPINRLNNFAPFQCNYQDRPKKCNNPKVCNLWHKSGVRYMRTCQPCPDVYPWTGKSGVRNSRVDNEIINE